MNKRSIFVILLLFAGLAQSRAPSPISAPLSIPKTQANDPQSASSNLLVASEAVTRLSSVRLIPRHRIVAYGPAFGQCCKPCRQCHNERRRKLVWRPFLRWKYYTVKVCKENPKTNCCSPCGFLKKAWEMFSFCSDRDSHPSTSFLHGLEDHALNDCSGHLGYHVIVCVSNSKLHPTNAVARAGNVCSRLNKQLPAPSPWFVSVRPSRFRFAARSGWEKRMSIHLRK